MTPLPGDAELTAWLAELEGFGPRRERFEHDARSGVVSRVWPWLIAAYQQGLAEGAQGRLGKPDTSRRGNTASDAEKGRTGHVEAGHGR